jgi:hypothetical protein
MEVKMDLKKGTLVRIVGCTRLCKVGNPCSCIGNINRYESGRDWYTVNMLNKNDNHNKECNDCGYWLERKWIIPVTSKRIK